MLRPQRSLDDDRGADPETSLDRGGSSRARCAESNDSTGRSRRGPDDGAATASEGRSGDHDVVGSVAVPDVVLPVLDEAAAIPSVLASLPEGFRPIVVDNGSTDGSGDVARSLGAMVVEEPIAGFGAACWAGLGAATADLVCFMDCDGSFDGADLPALVAPVAAGDVDLMLGVRRPQVDAGWPAHARIANKVLAAFLRRKAGVQVTDLGPMRVARREALLDLGIEDRRFGWPLEMVMRAARRGWRIEERPVAYAPRIGRSKVTGTVKGTMRAVRDMSSVARRLR